MTTKQRKVEHPAPWSAEVLTKLGDVVPAGTRVHDPFAGTGERLGVMADVNGWRFSGTEIEPVFIVDPRVKVGDATDRSTYPRRPFVIVTSPVYPNGIADDFNAQDGSTRRTYRSAKAKLVGRDERLAANNMGAYGYRGQPFHSTNRMMYWRLAHDSVRCWSRADAVYLNVSDFIARGEREPVVSQWIATLQIAGWQVVKSWPITTRRWRNGATRSARVEVEHLVYLTRDD